MLIRETAPEDALFLSRMFVEAARWRPEWPKEELAVLLRQPELARYFADWGRAGDYAAVAEPDAGAAWFRLFSAREPAYGFVRDDVPELGIAVASHARGRGIGRALLRHLQHVARERGHAGLSLSVHPENHARRLYASEGFATVREEENAVTMVRWV